MQIINDVVGADGESESTVDIMGDFSFATNAFLHGKQRPASQHRPTTCGLFPTAPGILKMEGTGDDVMVVGTTNPQNVAEFAEMMYLCIMVDPDDEDGMRIPETGVYTAMGDYEGAVEDAAFDPAPMKQTLGRIKRDGTTVRLPYLTTHEKFAQRLYIVNRGLETVYEMDFQEGDTPGAKASGMLEANSRTIIVSGWHSFRGCPGDDWRRWLDLRLAHHRGRAALDRRGHCAGESGGRFDRYGGLPRPTSVENDHAASAAMYWKEGLRPFFPFWE